MLLFLPLLLQSDVMNDRIRHPHLWFFLIDVTQFQHKRLIVLDWRFLLKKRKQREMKHTIRRTNGIN